MTDDHAALHAFVSGRVQGVGFRDFVLTRATVRGLSGYVRNLADGRVEVVAEGRRVALEALLDDLRRGPRGARVDGVAAEWGETSGEYERFVVTY